jgi:hypothetical protein
MLMSRLGFAIVIDIVIDNTTHTVSKSSGVNYLFSLLNTLTLSCALVVFQRAMSISSYNGTVRRTSRRSRRSSDISEWIGQVNSVWEASDQSYTRINHSLGWF